MDHASTLEMVDVSHWQNDFINGYHFGFFASRIPNSFIFYSKSYCRLLFSLYSTTSGSAKNFLLSEYLKKFSSILALRSVYKILFEVFYNCGTSPFEEESSMGLSLLTNTRLPSEPLSNRTRTNFCFWCLLLRWRW
jgi:hypothetical protein